MTAAPVLEISLKTLIANMCCHVSRRISLEIYRSIEAHRFLLSCSNTCFGCLVMGGKAVFVGFCRTGKEAFSGQSPRLIPGSDENMQIISWNQTVCTLSPVHMAFPSMLWERIICEGLAKFAAGHPRISHKCPRSQLIARRLFEGVCAEGVGK